MRFQVTTRKCIQSIHNRWITRRTNNEKYKFLKTKTLMFLPVTACSLRHPCFSCLHRVWAKEKRCLRSQAKQPPHGKKCYVIYFLGWIDFLTHDAPLRALRFSCVFRMAEASPKRVTGDEPQGTMGRVQTAGEAPARSCVVFFTGRPPSVSGGRCWLKSEQRSFVIYRRNTYEQYGGYNLFQNAEFKANVSIKVWGKC